METRSVRMGFSDELFPMGSHICLVYRDEAERRSIVSKYVESGLLDHEQLYYFADTATPQEVISWMHQLDVDIAPAVSSGACTVADAVETYCPGGAFEPDEMLERLKQTWAASQEHHFAGCRVTGEMSWALRNIPGTDRLIEYESRVNDVLQTHPLTAMCQYNANSFSGELIFQILEVHPYMVARGQLVRNPYYLRHGRDE